MFKLPPKKSWIKELKFMRNKISPSYKIALRYYKNWISGINWFLKEKKLFYPMKNQAKRGPAGRPLVIQSNAHTLIALRRKKIDFHFFIWIIKGRSLPRGNSTHNFVRPPTKDLLEMRSHANHARKKVNTYEITSQTW